MMCIFYVTSLLKFWQFVSIYRVVLNKKSVFVTNVTLYSLKCNQYCRFVVFKPRSVDEMALRR